jgi:hypothetical protein
MRRLPIQNGKQLYNSIRPVDVVFNFSTDTLDVTNVADNSSLETMKYTLKDTVLTIQKYYTASHNVIRLPLVLIPVPLTER